MIRWLRKRAPLVTVLFFLLLTLAGLLTSADYGLPCDEPAEQDILRENLYEYATRLLGSQSDAARYYQANGVQLISQSIERDHGESAYYLAAPILQLQADAPDTMTVLWHAYTWLWFMAGVIALYRLMRQLGLNRFRACATALFLYLSPRFFAEGHYNNKDVVLLSLTLCTLASGLRFQKKPSLPSALLFSLFGALAANTKIIGALPWGLMGLAALWSLAARKELTRKNIIAGISAILAFGVFYLLLTPAAWVAPRAFARYLLGNAANFTRWSGLVLFNGVYYNPARTLPLPRTYLPVMIALTTPIPYLLFAVVGQVRALFLMARRDSLKPTLIALTLLWLIPFAYVVLARPVLYNSWRHFYFLYAPIAVMAGLGLQTAWQALGRSRVRRSLGAVALAAIFGWQAVGITLNHPYQYAYYNALARDVPERYELDYWDVSTLDAMRRLSAEPQRDQTLPLVLGARDYMSHFGIEHGIAVLPAALRDAMTVTDDPDAPYLFYNTTYEKIYGIDPPEGYRALFSISGYGNVLCTVYERNAEAPATR
jgi:hypothetical protein